MIFIRGHAESPMTGGTVLKDSSSAENRRSTSDVEWGPPEIALAFTRCFTSDSERR